MMSQYHFQKVRKLRQQGFNKSEISTKLGIDWKTVAKYWESNSPPESKPRTHRTRPDPLLGFDQDIQTLFEHVPEILAIDVFERIRRSGYLGSERTVQRRIEKIQGEKPKERFFEQTYTPAEQTQFDFKENVELVFADGPRIVNLHFGTLPFSGKTRVRGYPFLNYECFIDGVHDFFKGIGGLTLNIRIDNLSPCVRQVLEGRKRLWTDRFQKAIDHYGFGVLPCTPAKGNEKGHVERDIRTYSRRIKLRAKLEAMVFKDWEHLNQWLEATLEDEQKLNSILQEKFILEQSKLQILALANRDVLCRVELLSTQSYGTVRFGKSVYSVPDTAIEVQCCVVIGAYELEIFRVSGTKASIAKHPRKSDGDHSILLEHIVPSLIRKPQAMIRWAHRDILFPDPILKRFYNYLLKIDSYSAERVFLRSINLIQYSTLKEISVGVELIMSSQSNDAFEDLKALLLIERKPCSVIDITALFEQQPLKPKLSDYDCFIPKTGEGKR